MIVLRELRHDADRDALTDLFLDAETQLWNVGPDAAGIAGWCERNLEIAADFRTWAVADPGDDRLLGVVSVFNVNTAGRTGEIGYRTVPAERGRGVATAAVRAATGLAWTIFADITRLELFHAGGNAASCAVAGRAGYTLVESSRSTYVYGDGQLHDEHRHAMERPA